MRFSGKLVNSSIYQANVLLLLIAEQLVLHRQPGTSVLSTFELS